MIDLTRIYDQVRDCVRTVVEGVETTPPLENVPWPELVQRRENCRRAHDDMRKLRNKMTHARIQMVWDVVNGPVSEALEREIARVTDELERRGKK